MISISSKFCICGSVVLAIHMATMAATIEDFKMQSIIFNEKKTQIQNKCLDQENGEHNSEEENVQKDESFESCYDRLIALEVFPPKVRLKDKLEDLEKVLQLYYDETNNYIFEKCRIFVNSIVGDSSKSIESVSSKEDSGISKERVIQIKNKCEQLIENSFALATPTYDDTDPTESTLDVTATTESTRMLANDVTNTPPKNTLAKNETKLNIPAKNTLGNTDSPRITEHTTSVHKVIATTGPPNYRTLSPTEKPQNTAAEAGMHFEWSILYGGFGCIAMILVIVYSTKHFRRKGRPSREVAV
ncbi:uncharacterized protein LOC142973851 [Anticarsia gemmatalis]|uniref:uncharacterized protein LOC142973851 n=1 Tax=Anticarsia gemmatalis TaxID=129554 RepID=UPI003F770ADA